MQNTSTTYYPSINALRGIAALMVCLFHFTMYSDNRGDYLPEGDWIRAIGSVGHLGVYIFFVITGFVIPLSMKKYNYSIRNIGKYILKRWVRIEIPYLSSIVLMLLPIVYFSFRNNAPIDVNGEQLIHHFFYTIPFSDYNWLNSIYWTLAVEFQFYIFIALIFPVLQLKNDVLKIALLLAWGALGIYFYSPAFFLNYGGVFGMGIALFLYKHEDLNKYVFWPLIGLLFILSFLANGWEIAVVAGLTTLLIEFTSINNKVLNNLGDVSYSLYLTHGFVGGNILLLLNQYSIDYAWKLVLILALLIGSIAFAWIYWRILENPSKKWSQKVKL